MRLLAALFVLLASYSAAPAAPCATPVMTCPDIASLMNEREGYGRFARGGLDGQFVTVTSDADAGPGTLRDIVQNAVAPTWVRFANDMTITLKTPIAVPPNVTVDGRGHAVVIHGYGFQVRDGTHDVILTHLTVDMEFKTEAVGVDVFNEAHDIWLNHLTLERSIDRLINVKIGATDVTISWVLFERHNKVMLVNNLTEDNLFANYDRDARVRVTMHHNYFIDTVQRHPRAQIGTVHLYNNLLENWDYYGMSFSLEAKATVEGNIFSNRANRPCTEPPYFDTVEKEKSSYCRSIPAAPARTALVNGESDREHYERTRAKYGYTHDWRAFLKVRDNLYLGDSKPVLADYMAERVPAPPYCYSYEAPSDQLAARIRQGAGNTGVADARVKATCPAVVENQAPPRQPAFLWRNYSNDSASLSANAAAGEFVIAEKPGARAERGILQYFYGQPHERWKVEFLFKPNGARAATVAFADAAAQADGLQATCGTDRAEDQSKASATHQVKASVAADKDGFYRCTIEGVPGPKPGNRLRIDIMSADGRSSIHTGADNAGLTIKDIRIQPAQRE